MPAPRAFTTLAAISLLAAPPCAAAPAVGATPAPDYTVTVDPAARGAAIDDTMYGVFFEDINYAADGGLYAELVRNRSFEFLPVDRAGWNGLTAWTPTAVGGGSGTARTVDGAARLDERKVLEALTDYDLARLFRRSMPISSQVPRLEPG